MGLTILPPSCSDCLEIWEPQPTGILRACPGLYRDCFNFYLYILRTSPICLEKYRSADKSLARPTSRYILFDGENISFDASLVIYT